jgi:hypothetical protein
MIPQTPRAVIMAVVVLIGAITLAIIVGAVLLILNNDTVPDSLWTLAGAGLGGLTALLASTRAAVDASPSPAPAQPTSSAPAPVPSPAPAVAPPPAGG